MVRNRSRNRNEEAPNRPTAGASTPVSRAADRAAARAAATTIIPEREDEQEQSQVETRAAPSTSVATTNGNRQLGGVNARNAFETYGQQMSISSITGTLIKFNKGDWVTGDDEDLEENMELVANMDQLMVGWIKWVDNRPAEQIMGPVAEGYQAQRRNELGDLDQGEWEIDEQGRARDPWQFSNYIVMKEPGQDASEENLYTFATSSKGGLGAIGSLCRDFGKEMRIRPDEYPIVALGGDSYNHREFGRTKVPTLTIVGWEPKAQFAATTTVTRTAAPEPAPAPATAGRSRSPRSRRAA